MKVAALIGDPVGHSVAPVLHEYLAARTSQEFRYVKLSIPPERVDAAATAMVTLRFAGYNVTLPHKEAVGASLDTVDTVATSVGAVNTVIIDDAGRSIGTNTDWIGIADGLIQHGHPRRVEADRRAVVLGSGGAARAAIYALTQLGYAAITVFYREPADLKTIALRQQALQLSSLEMRTYSDVAEYIERADTVVNMTSAGMADNDPAPFDLARIAHLDLRGKWFLDAVFNPLRTPFLELARRNQAVAIDGLWMMIFQGIPAFSAWTGRVVKLDQSQLNEIHMVLSTALQDVR